MLKRNNFLSGLMLHVLPILTVPFLNLSFANAQIVNRAHALADTLADTELNTYSLRESHSGLEARSGLPQIDCKKVKSQDGQYLFKCQQLGSNIQFHVLDVYGDIAETAYYHGLFLGPEISQGLLKGVLDQKAQALAALTDEQKKQFGKLTSCIMNHYRNGVSEEFIEMNSSFAQGLRHSGTKIEDEELLDINLMIELSIEAESLQRKMERNAKGLKSDLFQLCGPYFVWQTLVDVINAVAKPIGKIKMGCTGLATSQTVDNQMIHGRNFDTGLLGYYEKSPLIIVHHLPDGNRVTSLTTAGLHYGGAVSGFNSYGISISVHELSTEGTAVWHEVESTDSTPYLAHRILMEARSLDDAINLIQERKGFGAWTLLVSDSKTNQAASIEISGNTVVVARSGVSLAQSNHFIAPETRLAGFEYSFNKTLESKSRFNYVTDTIVNLAATFNIQDAINTLGGHTDYFTGLRSFGRTTTKVYTAATHVMKPSQQEFWMTFGEIYPTTQGQFLGFQVIANERGQLPIKPIGQTMADQLPNLESWYHSQEKYVKAFLAFEHNAFSLPATDLALQLLDEAITLSKKDQVFEFAYHFMTARTLIWKAYLQQKAGLPFFQTLVQAGHFIDTIENQLSKMTVHPYEVLQVSLWKKRLAQLQNTQVASQTDTVIANQIKILKVDYLYNWELQKIENSLNTVFKWNQLEKPEFPTVE